MASIISREQAERILEPYIEAIGLCLWRAWASWEATPFPISITPRARANLVYDYAVAEAWRTLNGVNGLTLSESRGFLLVSVEDKLLLRLKKFRRSLRTSGIPTGQQLEFASQQLTIPGMPPMTKLVAGYLLDAFQLRIDRVAITCSVGTRIIWTLNIPKPAAGAVVPLQTALQSAPVSPFPSRVRSTRTRKRESEEKGS